MTKITQKLKGISLRFLIVSIVFLLSLLIKQVNGFSFPSGHSFSSFTFCGLLICILWNHKITPVVRWIASVLFSLFVCVVALSRVYLYVHYASDVVAAFFMCTVWLAISFWVMKRFQHKLP